MQNKKDRYFFEVMDAASFIGDDEFPMENELISKKKENVIQSGYMNQSWTSKILDCSICECRFRASENDIEWAKVHELFCQTEKGKDGDLYGEPYDRCMEKRDDLTFFHFTNCPECNHYIHLDLIKVVPEIVKKRIKKKDFSLAIHHTEKLYTLILPEHLKYVKIFLIKSSDGMGPTGTDTAYFYAYIVVVGEGRERYNLFKSATDVIFLPDQIPGNYLKFIDNENPETLRYMSTFPTEKDGYIPSTNTLIKRDADDERKRSFQCTLL